MALPLDNGTTEVQVVSGMTTKTLHKPDGKNNQTLRNITVSRNIEKILIS